MGSMSNETGWLRLSLPSDVTVANVAEQYVEARDEAAALEQRIGERRALLISRVDDQLRLDPVHVEETARLAMLRRKIEVIEDRLATYFGDRTGRVSVDAGRLLVTWGKRRETWSLAKSAAWVGSSEGMREIAVAISAAISAGDGAESPAERALRAARAARAVVDLLGPKRKEGELPPPTITVRPPAGHDDTSGGEQ